MKIQVLRFYFHFPFLYWVCVRLLPLTSHMMCVALGTSTSCGGDPGKTLANIINTWFFPCFLSSCPISSAPLVPLPSSHSLSFFHFLSFSLWAFCFLWFSLRFGKNLQKLPPPLPQPCHGPPCGSNSNFCSGSCGSCKHKHVVKGCQRKFSQRKFSSKTSELRANVQGLSFIMFMSHHINHPSSRSWEE